MAGWMAGLGAAFSAGGRSLGEVLALQEQQRQRRAAEQERLDSAQNTAANLKLLEAQAASLEAQRVANARNDQVKSFIDVAGLRPGGAIDAETYAQIQDLAKTNPAVATLVEKYNPNTFQGVDSAGALIGGIPGADTQAYRYREDLMAPSVRAAQVNAEQRAKTAEAKAMAMAAAVQERSKIARETNALRAEIARGVSRDRQAQIAAMIQHNNDMAGYWDNQIAIAGANLEQRGNIADLNASSMDLFNPEAATTPKPQMLKAPQLPSVRSGGGATSPQSVDPLDAIINKYFPKVKAPAKKPNG